MFCKPSTPRAILISSVSLIDIRIQKQFGSLNDWLKSKNKDDPAGKAYEHALQEVNEHLKKNVCISLS